MEEPKTGLSDDSKPVTDQGKQTEGLRLDKKLIRQGDRERSLQAGDSGKRRLRVSLIKKERVHFGERNVVLCLVRPLIDIDTIKGRI